MQYSFSTILLAFSTLAMGVLAAPAAEPQTIFPPVGGPDKTKVYINKVGYGGTGCPGGSADVSFSQDRTNVVLSFDAYVASVGPGTDITLSRRACNVNFDLVYPPGWSYTIYQTTYTGFIDIQKYVDAYQTSKYSFSVNPGSSFTLSSKWSGPLTKDYEFTDSFAATAVVWSPCNSGAATLNVASSLRLDNSKDRKAYGQITTDTITGRVKQILGIAWRKC